MELLSWAASSLIFDLFRSKVFLFWCSFHALQLWQCFASTIICLLLKHTLLLILMRGTTALQELFHTTVLDWLSKTYRKILPNVLFSIERFNQITIPLGWRIGWPFCTVSQLLRSRLDIQKSRGISWPNELCGKTIKIYFQCIVCKPRLDQAANRASYAFRGWWKGWQPT